MTKARLSMLALLIVLHSTGCEALQSEVPVKVSISEDGERIYVAAFNVSNQNFLWESRPAAEQTGDIEFEVYQDERRRVSRLQLLKDLDDEGLVWVQPGDGLAFSRRKSTFAARFNLEPGCYRVMVRLSNRAARKAFDSEKGLPGPEIDAQSEKLRICFDGVGEG